MAERPDPYVRRDPGDVIRSGDWNELQVQAREEVHGHRHRGGADGLKIPRDGIEAQAIDGSLIDPAASVTLTSLTSNALTVNTELKVNGRTILAELDDLLSRFQDLDKGKVNRAGDTISGTLSITGKLAVGTSNPGSYALNVSGTNGDNALHLASDFGLRGDDKLNIIKFGNDGDYQLLHKASGALKRNTLAMHVNRQDAFGVYSSGWTPLLEVEGGSGDLWIKGKQNKLNIADNFSAVVRCADFTIGHSKRRGKPGRALCDLGKILSINHNGDWPGGVRYSGPLVKSSSRKIKREITELGAKNAQKLLHNLNPVMYFMKHDQSDAMHLGFIAEDVPELIASSDRRAVNHDHIVAVLTGVVKAQQDSLFELTEKVTKLAAASPPS